MLQWLGKEACGKQVVYYIIGFAILNLVLQTSGLKIAELLAIDLSSMSKNTMTDTTPDIFYMMIVPVLMEEATFRLGPIFCAKKLELSTPKILMVALISSVAFGYLHGNVYNIFFQGTAGFLYSLLLLKCGGLQEHYGKALVVPIICLMRWLLLRFSYNNFTATRV